MKSFSMWCLACASEVPGSKHHGLVPRVGRTPARLGWWNRCGECGMYYAAPPSLTVRAATRAYERRTQQTRLPGLT